MDQIDAVQEIRIRQAVRAYIDARLIQGVSSQDIVAEIQAMTEVAELETLYGSR